MHRCLSLCLLLAACRDNPSSPVDAPRADTPPMIDAAIDAAIDAPIDAPQVPATTRVWVRGDILTDNQNVAAAFGHGQGTLPYGTANPPPITIDNVRVFDARGGKIAYVTAALATDPHDLYVAGADNSSPLKIVTGTAGIEITGVALSPDGTKVAFTMDSVAINGGYDLYVVPAAGGTPVKVSPDRSNAAPIPADLDVFNVFTWSANSTYLAFSADLTENAYDQAYAVDTTAGTPTAVELLARADIATQTAGAQGVRGNLLFDSANNVYFRARVTMGSAQFELFRATTTGTRTSFALPARGDNTTPDAGSFAITPDGTKIVFAADAPTLGQFDLHVATLPDGAATKITTLAAAGNPSLFATMELSPDGSKVALVADFLAGDNNFEPFVVHLDGSTQTPRRLVSLAVTCSACTSVDADAMQWNKEGTALYVLGDLTANNDTRLFLVDPTQSDQTPTLAVTTPTTGDVFEVQARPIP